MKYLIIASSGVEDFICVSDSPVDSDAAIPTDSKCVRLKTKSSTLEGFCPPVGQKIPKESYVVYDEVSEVFSYYEASANNDCSISYTKKDVEFLTKPKFRYFRVLIVYGFSVKMSAGSDNYGNTFYYYPSNNQTIKDLVPFRYEAWYFEFDSIEDAYAWKNPRPYNLTPISSSLEPILQTTTNYNRGVGYARAIDIIPEMSSYLHPEYGLQDIDDENGTHAIFYAYFNDTSSTPPSGNFLGVGTLSGDFTKVRLYNDRGFTNMLYNAAYNNYRYQDIPLWPLRRQFSTSFDDEEAESIQEFSNLYVVGIEHLLPDRYFAQNPSYDGPVYLSGWYNKWAYVYTLTPSLEKLDELRSNYTQTSLRIRLSLPYGDFELERGFINFPHSGSICSLGWTRKFYYDLYNYENSVLLDNPRTLYYNLDGAVLFAMRKTNPLYDSSPLYEKPPITFPIKIGSIWGFKAHEITHYALKLGISIVYVVQYGRNEQPQKLVSYPFEDVCPPTTIPNSQWILNL